jgi:hypothetical protein
MTDRQAIIDQIIEAQRRNAVACIDAVWVVLDHRHEPDRLVDKCAWADRYKAEERAHEMRQYYKCSLDAIQVERLSVMDGPAEQQNTSIHGAA